MCNLAINLNAKSMHAIYHQINLKNVYTLIFFTAEQETEFDWRKLSAGSYVHSKKWNSPWFHYKLLPR